MFYAKSVLGVQRIDARAKTVEVRSTDVPLESCEATFPVPDGAVEYGWANKGGRRTDSFKAPPGWRLVRVPAKVARKGVYAAHGRFSGKDPADRASVDAAGVVHVAGAIQLLEFDENGETNSVAKGCDGFFDPSTNYAECHGEVEFRRPGIFLTGTNLTWNSKTSILRIETNAVLRIQRDGRSAIEALQPPK